jgi:hypothetical protein
MPRKLTPWTLLRRQLEPLVLELHAAAPWRVCNHRTLEEWIRSQTWEELWWGDEACAALCEEPPQLGGMLFDPRVASESTHPEGERLREWMTRQMMHRMLFAMDLRKMPAAWRREFPLTGHWPSDARMVLIQGWRSNAPLVWAQRFGENYLGDCEE